jgi:hypothetical protein
VAAQPARLINAVIIPLPHDAWCVLPAAHAAHASPAAAQELVHALAEALRVIHVSK